MSWVGYKIFCCLLCISQQTRSFIICFPKMNHITALLSLRLPIGSFPWRFHTNVLHAMMFLQLGYTRSVSFPQNVLFLCLFIYLLTREPFVQLKISSLIITIINLGQRNNEHRSPHACRPAACQLPSLCVLLTWMLTVVSLGFLCLLFVLTKRCYAEAERASRCPTSTLTTRGHIFSWLESK